MTVKTFSPMTAEKILDDQFLDVRARLIDIAAVLDRLRRAQGSVAGDARLEMICQSLRILASDTPDKTEQIQLLFSIQ
jgi:hypothetical protein